MLALCTGDAKASHQVYLPLVPNTPLLRSVIATQSFTWCVDTRAQAYPGFVEQLRDVTHSFEERVGIRNRQVDFADPSCQVRHTMPSGLQCGGCAAQVWYANWPVLVEYQYALGYLDWRTAQGHELGHALLGLHEQYDDVGGTLRCTGRQDTVMDCASGVRYPTRLDVERGCALLATPWCGAPAACEPCWDGSRWQFASGWSYEPATDFWYYRELLYWLGRDAYGWRYSPPAGIALAGGTVFWHGESSVHLVVP